MGASPRRVVGAAMVGAGVAAMALALQPTPEPAGPAHDGDASAVYRLDRAALERDQAAIQRVIAEAHDRFGEADSTGAPPPAPTTR